MNLAKFFGSHLTPGEKLGNAVSPLIGIALAVGLAASQEVNWAWWQWLVAALLGADLMGGVFTNASNAAKRNYDTTGGDRGVLLFAAGHVHPLILPLLFDVGWLWAGCLYGGMVGTTAMVVALPLVLRRPAAMVLYATGLAVLMTLVPVPAALAWVAPVFLLKLLLAHGVREPVWPSHP